MQQTHLLANSLAKAHQQVLHVPQDSVMGVQIYTLPMNPKLTNMHGSKLFLGGHDHWQLWDVKEASLIMTGKPESQEDEETVTSFGSFHWTVEDQIAAYTSDKAFVWSIKQKERIFTVRLSAIVSCISMDSRGILIGDTEGGTSRTP